MGKRRFLIHTVHSFHKKPLHDPKSQCLFTLYFRLTITISCIFCENSCEIYILSPIHHLVVVKMIILWCVHHLEDQRWSSTSFSGDIWVH